MELPKSYDPQRTEQKIYQFWQKTGFFNPDKLPARHKRPYCITIPPPNITGNLHMGHALTYTLQDVLIRLKRMQGYKALLLPGIDHAGIATQNVVEKQLRKEGTTRFKIGREKFLERAWQWKERYGESILEQFKILGHSMDWSRTAFTLDKGYVDAVYEAFGHYFKKGLVVRGRRMVNWCPRCQTSLSDLELERNTKEGSLWHIRYPMEGMDKDLVVATTRPETLLGDMAVAVHPKDKRYKNFVGRNVQLPLTERTIPVIADESVEMEFGTGAVKVTPSHDFLDYEIALRHNLQFLQIISERGKMTEHVPERFRTLPVAEARPLVEEELSSKGFLVKKEPYELISPSCERCGTIIQPLLSWQWYLKMDKLAQNALSAHKKGKVTFVPKRFEKIYVQWLSRIRDWCISRQIWWGHRIPLWYCAREKEPSEYFFSKKAPARCSRCGSCTPRQVEDVFDTWFSSALWPFASLGWPKNTKDLKTFYPADALFTARDIINLWVARMIFSGMEFMKKVPFPAVFINPTVLNKQGQRMSKSLGTGVDFHLMVEKYGADAVRFGLVYQALGGQDMRFGEDNIVMGKKFCNKVWNASRYLLMRLPEERISCPRTLSSSSRGLAKEDKRILRELKAAQKSMLSDMDRLRFGEAAHKAYEFFWHRFCDVYIEETKEKIEHNKTTRKVLAYTLLSSLKMLHPFVPFLTEEIYQIMPLTKKKRSLMIEELPKR